MKKTIRMTENEVERLVFESAMRVLNEGGPVGSSILVKGAPTTNSQVGNSLMGRMGGNTNTGYFDGQGPTIAKGNFKVKSLKDAQAMLKRIGYNGKGSWIPLARKAGLDNQTIQDMRYWFNGQRDIKNRNSRPVSNSGKPMTGGSPAGFSDQIAGNPGAQGRVPQYGGNLEEAVNRAIKKVIKNR